MSYEQRFFRWFRWVTQKQWNWRWVPYTESEIQAMEAKWGFDMPHDYRALLLELGGFINWQAQDDVIRHGLDWPHRGLLDGLKYNGRWLTSWGPRPSSLDDRVSAFRALFQEASCLFPLRHHRYAVFCPDVGHCIVLSIYGWDIIIYADSIVDYLMGRDVIPASQRQAIRELAPHWVCDPPEVDYPPEDAIASIPFWGEFILSSWNETDSDP